jgi:putative nucleotidyltransferase with HDIG domain
MSSVEAIIRSSRQLPPFPGVVTKALDLINNPKTSVREIVEVIQYDQAITSNALRICNSAQFGLRTPVSSLNDALLFLGFNQLFEIIMSWSTGSTLGRAIPGYDLEAGELWKHSVSTALLSQILSKHLRQDPSPLLFTAALIHDIGKVMLHSYVKDEFETINNMVQSRRISFSEAEKEVLGIDHAELSAKITENWNFPREITQVIRYHHSPLLADFEQELVFQVYLCDVIALMAGLGGGVDGLSYPGVGQVMTYFGLNEKDIERIMAQLGDQIQKVEAMIQIQ